MRRGRGMGRASPEGEVDARVGEAHGVVDAVDRGGMPGDGDVDVAEVALTHHEDLGRPALFRGAAVIAYPSLEAVRREVVLHRRRGKECRRPQQVVTAAVAMSAGHDLPWLGDARD